MRNDNTQQRSEWLDAAALGISNEVLRKIKVPRKFEIFVEEFSENESGTGGVWKPVISAPELGGEGRNPVITVSSFDELNSITGMYQQIGQRFRIVNEVERPTRETVLALAKEQGIDVDGEHAPDGGLTDTQCAQDAPAAENRQLSQPSCPAQLACAQKAKPKIVTIGDTQIKYDGDKVYQRQWVKLGAGESENYRLVSDSSNKIVSMAGKHIEAKRWVIIEEDENMEEQDNG